MSLNAPPARTRTRLLLALVSSVLSVSPLAANVARAEPAASVRSDRTDASRLSVEVVGAGPDLILIPGLASSREVWRPLADRLSATCLLYTSPSPRDS